MSRNNRRRKKTEFWDSAWKNNYTFLQYYNRLVELSIAMFEWKNLPETVDPRYLELKLFTEGQAVFFEDDGELGYLALPVAMNGQFNVYKVPTRRRAYAVNGYQKQLTMDDSVIIYNNMIRTNSWRLVNIYARRLWDIDRSIDVNARAQKTPVVLQCSEAQRLTALNLFKEVDGNAPVIMADKNLDINDVMKAVDIGAPYVADKLYQLKTEIWNEALTRLGISNVSYQKKERLISDEITRSMGGTIASRLSRLEMRKEACQQINDMFGLNMDVEFREDFQELVDVADGMNAGKENDNE